MAEAPAPQICVITSRSDATELAEVVDLLASTPGSLGVDTETTGLDPREDRVRLISLAAGEYALVVDLNAFREGDERQVDWSMHGLHQLYELLTGVRPKVLQNAAFDLNFLRGEGLVLGGSIFDTMFAAKIVNNGTGDKNDLGAIVRRELQMEMGKELQKANWAGELTEEMLRYSAMDAWCLPRLVRPLMEKLKKSRVGAVTLYDVFKLESQCLRPVASMQWNGFRFDSDRAREVKAELEGQAQELMVELLDMIDARLKARFPDEPGRWLPKDPDGSYNTRTKDEGSIRKGTKRYKGFNPRSTQQMTEKFTEVGIILPPNEKGVPSMDQNLLAFIRADSPLVDLYLRWKKEETLVSHLESLLKAVGSDGRIHAGYRQMGTDTGRLSCSGPNLQQVPKEGAFRELFYAEDGWTLVDADFSQVELRVAAELSEEPRMLEAYAAGRDLHTETAALMARVPQEEVTSKQRSSAKLCFSGDTELLTPEGWVRLDSYEGGPVAQYSLPAGVELNRQIKKPGPGYVAGLPPAWDGNCGSIEFVNPLHYEGFESDDVWANSDRNTDIVATGNHEILFIDAYGNAIKKALTDVVSPRSFVAAGYLKRSRGIGELKSRLLAMVVADGSFKQTAGWVSLGFSKRRKIFRCENLLNECEISYKKAKYSNGDSEPTTMFKFKLEETSWIRAYVNEDKELDFASCIAEVDALAYLAEAQYWDGIALEGSKRDRVIVGTTVKRTADVMQAMAVTSGIPCTVHTEEVEQVSTGLFYRVSYVFRTSPTWRPTWEPTKTKNQKVFCVQVPSGLVLIRRNGKVCVQGNCNFGLLYGAGPATLRKQSVAQYKIDIDHKEATRLVNQFRDAYPRLYEWQVEQGEGTTTSVFTRYGRRRILVGFNDKFTTRINSQVQGTAGDIAKIAIAKLWERLAGHEDEAKLIAMVHDEIILEVKKEFVDKWKKLLKQSMEEAGAVVCKLVPIVADVAEGATWAEAK